MHAPAGFTSDHADRAKDIDIRLELLHAQRGPGVRLTHEEIAAFAGCSDTLVLEIERRALRKLRTAAAARGITIEDLHALFTA